ncbi:MAG: N-methylhydantoinase A [Gammaproteobacteria bacterium]|jgi:N-methylhydantoinase A
MKPANAARRGYRVAADIGGTFTDVALVAPDGALLTAKLLSTPDSYGHAVVAGVQQLLTQAGCAAAAIDEVLHGCTIATNAILEHKGARTALVTTEGFRDVLELRRIRTPRLYAPLWQKPPPLVPRHLRFEVAERIGADGTVVRVLDENSLDAVVEALAKAEVEAIAVCLINAFANPAHELRIGERLREAFPNCFVTLAIEVLPQIREYERTSTVVINAYVGPPVKTYLEAMIEQLAAMGVRGRLLVMQSSGGVLSAQAVLEKPAQIIECGPAAGVIGAAKLGAAQGYHNIITFDMGGTTAKASLVEHGSLSTSEEYEVGATMSTSSALMAGAGYALKLPVIDISEVGAGGGSIVRVDKGGAIKVGPDSAGAQPGPVCYGQGGSAPTVTDANVVLGYLNPVALAGGTVPIDAAAARQAVSEQVAAPLGRDLMETAFGIHLVANTNMMRAVKAVTTNRGRDTRDFVMFAFGGSGGVHAATLARELRIAQVVIPAAAGVFSALGLLFADSELNESHSFLRPLAAINNAEADTIYTQLRSDIAVRLERSPNEVSFKSMADLRYAGQAFELSIAVPDDCVGQARIDELSRRFDAEHQQRYGHNFEGQYPLEVVNLRLIGTVPSGNTKAVPEAVSTIQDLRYRQAYFGAEFGLLSTPVCERAAVSAQPMQGPMVIEEYEGTVVVPPYANVRLDPNGSLVLEISGP